MDIAGIPINWFDFAVVGLLVAGLIQGRRRGMSNELLDCLKWLLTVGAAAEMYRPLGSLLSDSTHLGRVTGFLLAYVFVLLLLRIFFGWVKRIVGEKLVGSDVFGDWEYFCGMIAGGIRFACYLVVALALLNAGALTPEQLAAQARMQRKMFEDISFPTFGSVQHNIFAGSASGKLVKKYLSHELIVATDADKEVKRADTLGRREERALSEILGEKK